MTTWLLFPDATQIPVTAAEVKRLPAVTVLEDGVIAVDADLGDEQRAWMRRRAVGIAQHVRGARG